MTDATLLRVERLGVRHRDADRATPVEVSFSVRPGEAWLVLGPSGCGKSTLALALNGLIPKDIAATVTGEVRVGATPLTELSMGEASARIAMVFQDADAQIVAPTVADEVAFGPENLCLPVDEIERRIESSLRAVGLWERRAEAPEALSGGGRQRLAIAAALAMGTPMLVLDEPTANLDPRGTAEVYAALERVLAAGDRGIVLVEHNLDAALRIATHVLVLDHEGRVALSGDPRTVFVDGASALTCLGVWQPAALIAAERLRDAGYAVGAPLTLPELRAQLDAAPPVAPGGRVPGLVDAPTPTTDGGAATTADADGPPALEARALTLRRGSRTVLDDVHLRIPRGEFVAVVGPNGAGKTTLLHALGGMLPLPREVVRVDGLDVSRLRTRELRRRLGIVFQNPEHQFLTSTVRDELALGWQRDGAVDAEIAPRVERLLRRFDLEGSAAQHPFLLSGGQQRRLSVATALADGARILLLDEPTFGQDRARASALIDEFAQLHRDGATIVLTTHDLQLAVEVADRLVVVDGGRIAADGPVDEVLEGDVLERVGLGVPPLARVFRGLRAHPELASVRRLHDLPGGAA